jgi:acetyl-CoA/propionyl-CoA carboxylase biotin carboxyl carrier protein
MPKPIGHAIEFRINAEDPARGFIPAFGQLTRFHPPSGIGIRLDTGVMTGSVVSSHFDSLIAKLIVTGATREIAIQRAKRALAHFEIEGIASVLPFHRAILSDADFIDEFKVHTRWIEQDSRHDYPHYSRSKLSNQVELQRYPIEIDGKLHQIGLPNGFFSLVGTQPPNQKPNDSDQNPSSNSVLAPMSGVITVWKVQENDHVNQGETIAIMEAMKMEVPVIAPQTGKIQKLIEINQTVETDSKIAEIN